MVKHGTVKKMDGKIIIQIILYVAIMTFIVIFLRKKELFVNAAPDVFTKMKEAKACAANCTPECKNKKYC